MVVAPWSLALPSLGRVHPIAGCSPLHVLSIFLFSSACLMLSQVGCDVVSPPLCCVCPVSSSLFLVLKFLWSICCHSTRATCPVHLSTLPRRDFLNNVLFINGCFLSVITASYFCSGWILDFVFPLPFVPCCRLFSRYFVIAHVSTAYHT